MGFFGIVAAVCAILLASALLPVAVLAAKEECDLALERDPGGRCTLTVDRLAADEFAGDSVNFRGREIRNAHLVDASIEALAHLTVGSLALAPPAARGGGGGGDAATGTGLSGLATIGGDGVVSSTPHARWDEAARELRLPRLSSFSKQGLEVRSDVDLTGHRLKNAHIEADTALDRLVFENGRIENSVLHNVTATDLQLGDVALDSLSIADFGAVGARGSLVVVGDGGRLEASPQLKLEKEGLDLNGQDVLNAHLRSGTIDGNIDVSVDHIKAKSVTLADVEEDKTLTTDALAVIGWDGTVRRGAIAVDPSGSLGDVKVHGSLDFAQSASSRGGEIRGAALVGGTADGLETLSVSGETELGSGLRVSGETYLEGSLTVGGSVLGSGPYVDVSDGRFKTRVERIGGRERGDDVLRRLLRLEGVSYELDVARLRRAGHPAGRSGGGPDDDDNRAPPRGGRQLGFLAQEVEALFPELVSRDERDFRGLQYARFAPLLVEGLKQLAEEVRDLREKIHALERRGGE